MRYLPQDILSQPCTFVHNHQRWHSMYSHRYNSNPGQMVKNSVDSPSCKCLQDIPREIPIHKLTRGSKHNCSYRGRLGFPTHSHQRKWRNWWQHHTHSWQKARRGAHPLLQKGSNNRPTIKQKTIRECAYSKSPPSARPSTSLGFWECTNNDVGYNPPARLHIQATNSSCLDSDGSSRGVTPQ